MIPRQVRADSRAASQASSCTLSLRTEPISEALQWTGTQNTKQQLQQQGLEDRTLARRSAQRCLIRFVMLLRSSTGASLTAVAIHALARRGLKRRRERLSFGSPVALGASWHSTRPRRSVAAGRQEAADQETRVRNHRARPNPLAQDRGE